MDYLPEDVKKWDAVIDASPEIPDWAKNKKREQLRAIVWLGEQLMKKGYSEEEVKAIGRYFGFGHLLTTPEKTWEDAKKLFEEKPSKT